MTERTITNFVEIVQFKVYTHRGKLIYNNDSPITGGAGRWQGIDSALEEYAYFNEIRIRDCYSNVSKENGIIRR